jgi:hypothetical protein
LTARKRSKPKKEKRPPKPKSATDIPDDLLVLKTPEDLEGRLQKLEDMAKSMAPQCVDAMRDRSRTETIGPTEHRPRLARKSHTAICRALREFAQPFFDCLGGDADRTNRDFAQRIKDSEALRILAGYERLDVHDLTVFVIALTMG